MSRLNRLNHLAIIPDGNSRWAKKNSAPISLGYSKGAQRIEEMIEYSRSLGIHTLTVWGLSTENWLRRPKGEIKIIIRIFSDLIDKHVDTAIKEGVKIVHLGRKNQLPSTLLKKLQNAEERTKLGSNHVLNIALDYGGINEILSAAHGIASDAVSGKLKPNSLDPSSTNSKQIFEEYLFTAGQAFPNPDFIIRTSGEQRMSGFMPWQTIHSEFYFTDKFWPDFTTRDLDKAVKEFYGRQRRFGGGH